MDGIITIIGVFLAVGVIFLIFGFFVWRNVLRFAKGIERGIKMVPILIHLPPPSEDVEKGGRDQREVIQESISQAEVLYNLIAGTFKKGFKSKFYGQRHISFEIIARDGLIKFFAAVPVALVPVIEQAIQTAYPTANLEEVEEQNVFSPTGKLTGTTGGEITLKQDYGYPIATFTNLKRDAIQAIINAMTSLKTGDGAAIQVLLRPAFSGWEKSSKKLVEDLKKHKKGSLPFSAREMLSAPFKVPEGQAKDEKEKQLSNLEQSLVEAVEEKMKHPGFEALIRVVASSGTAARAQAIQNNLVSAFALFDAPGSNGFTFNAAKDTENFVTAFIFRFFPPEVNRTILNSMELATLFHLPDERFTFTSQVERQQTKQVEAPSKLPDQGILLGYNSYRGVKKEIRLTDNDRARHVYVIGQTGTGKSTLLKQLIIQDMLAGKGLAFIDPHGDAAEELLALVPKSRTEDIIYFSPGEMDYPIGLNLFEYETEDQKDFLIQEAINMLYRLYDPQHTGIIGPMYEHWFRNAALAVMADPNGGTFIDIPKLFIDKQFLQEKLRHVKDPTVLDFWNKEMVQGSAGAGRQAEVMQWVVAKFGAFASNEMMRNIVGQVKSSIDLKQVMDGNKILIANLSKGRMGELNSMLLGMIFVMKFQAAAMSRASMPESERKPFSLYVDEFQNFSTDSFATILAEARKYRLSLIVANQYIAQLDEKIRDSVFGNVGTIVSFRSGPTDAEFLVKQFSPAFDELDLVNMPNFQAAMRVMFGGLPSQPFSMRILPPLEITNPQLGIALKQLSAAKYGKPRSQAEAEIFKRLETSVDSDPFANLARSSGVEGSLPPRRPTLKQPQKGSFLDDWLARRGRAGTMRPQPNLPSNSKNTMPKPLSKTEVKLQPPTPKKPPASSEQKKTISAPSQETKIVKPRSHRVGQQPQLQSPKFLDTKSKPESNIPSLKPGEIYIDEDGIIHQAASQST